MAGKDKEKGKKKKAAPKGNSKTGGGKHPEQEWAEQEEKRTLQEKATTEPKTPDCGALEGPALEGGEEKATEKREPFGEAKEEAQFPIVGVGASAGGLEALEAFFSNLPAESGLAFVVITHTDPGHQSMLPDLIKKKAKIPVKVLEDGMAAEPDTVFLPPSDRDPVLDQGIFHLEKRPARPDLHMPVDLFLKHLAEDRGRSAGCIILSGTGTDGTQGLRVIKEKGGLTVAQSSDSARHAGMPKSATETGLVDYVLPPFQMPERLIQYFKHPVAIRPKAEEEEKKKPDPLRSILAFLANRTRHDFSLYKENTLIRRIERRMTITSCRDASAYLRLLHQNPEEARALFQDLLIGVTNFFRDPEAFNFLRLQVLPELISRTEGNSLRVWIPGCATGEEAYSVAILLKECLEEAGEYRELQIFGTDIDPKAIEIARQGSYVQNIAADVDPDRLKRFFTKEDSRYQIKHDIREQVVFAEQNVLEDPPFSSLDLLVCRNLLIYLKPEAQNRLIPLFHYALINGGILFLGNSESVGSYHELFRTVSKQFNIYQKKDHVLGPKVQFPTGGRKLQRPDEEAEVGEQTEQTGQSVGRAAEKVLMEEHTPASVVVNEKGEILHFHGRTGKYLEPASGVPTLQIADMAREGLRFAVLSAMRRAREKKAEIREKDVWIKINGEHQRIDLIVKPFSEPPLKDCQLIVFADLPKVLEADKEEIRWSGEEDAYRVEELEQELMRLRQDYRSAMEELQTSNEELRSSNEELHSSNEELQSTNEELESSREELQSLNEELNTVNSELNSKMTELRDSYKAINAVLNNTQIAIVFLDNQFRIRRFTPEATQLFNVIESDVGRPIDHLTHNLEQENLVEKVRHVMKTLSPVDEEVRCEDGHWYRMRIMVYRPDEKTIEGLMLTFINIDAQKGAQEELREIRDRELSSARRFAENIVDTIREPLLLLDNQMRIVTANRSFYETFLYKPEETEGKNVFELGKGQWNIPELRDLLQEIIKNNRMFEGYVVEHRFPEVGFKRLLLNARALQDDQDEERRILLAMEDRTGDS